MIEIFGTEHQKALFLEKMYTGQWAGTMVLTEPEAGSDVGALTTSARKLPDGTYSITGNKIFITGGEHDMTDNIIHPVLARIEGAPAGTRGISLFIVPKIWVNRDGSLGDANDVVCTGIEEKMGIHASPTCSMAFGSKGQCRGMLLGEKNKGMKVMFHMMNAARLLVGAIGFTSASAAYLYALDYARERKQGRDLEKTFEPDAPQVSIIRHPDVRRMLMWMKVHVEGMRSFIYYGALLLDKVNCAADNEERAYHQGLLDLLTPVLKAYCTDRGFEVCSEAVQVYGGYGYTREYPVEQCWRDNRLNPIHEGTNGIQAMDLLGRKIWQDQSHGLQLLMQEMQVDLQAATTDRCQQWALSLSETLQQAVKVTQSLGKSLMEGDPDKTLANASCYLHLFGHIMVAWMWLRQANAASHALGSANTDDERNFYQGKLQAAQYFFHWELPTVAQDLVLLRNQDDTCLNMKSEWF